MKKKRMFRNLGRFFIISIILTVILSFLAYSPSFAAVTWTGPKINKTLTSVVASDPTNANVFYYGTCNMPGTGDPAVAQGLFKSTNKGDNWTQINDTNLPQATNISSILVDPTNGNYVYVGTFIQGFFRSNNGGTSWAAVNTGYGSQQAKTGTAGLAYSGGALYAGKFHAFELADSVAGAGLFKLAIAQSGTSWTDLTSNFSYANISSVVASGSRVFVATADIHMSLVISLACAHHDGTLKYSDNGGASWTEIKTGLPWGVNPSDNKVRAYLLAADPNSSSVCYCSTNVQDISTGGATPSAEASQGLYKWSGSGSWTKIKGGPGGTATKGYLSPAFVDKSTAKIWLGESYNDGTTYDHTIQNSTNGGTSWAYDAAGIPNNQPNPAFFATHPSNPTPVIVSIKFDNDTTKSGVWKGDPQNTPPAVSSVTASQAASGIVNISYNVTDAEQSTVTISFQYWNGSAWAECTTTTGEGSQAIGSGKTGTWTAKTDWPNQYTTTTKIRVTANDGQASNNIGTGDSANYTLDTKNPIGLANSSPANAATGVATTANLVCTAATDDSPAVNYYFQIWTTSATQNSGWIAGTSWAPTLANSTTYYWHVKAKDTKSNETSYTATWSFTTVSPNTPPVVSSVTASQAASGIVNISYNVTDAEQSTVTISFQYWNGSAWAECTTTTGEGSQAIGTGKTGTWTAKTDWPDQYTTTTKIRVTANDGQASNNIGTGDSATYTLDTKNPTGLANSSPADAATGVATTANLVCTAASDDTPPVNYYFQIALNSGFSTGVQNSGWQVGTSWAPTLSSATTYYWHVKANDAKSNETSYTATWSFTTAGTNTPPVVSSVTASQAASGIVNISYNVTDAEQGIVTISFQYWNGSAWAECTTTTGEGSQAIGSGKTGTWTAKTDWPDQYTTTTKIRVTANDGQASNNIGTGDSANYTLDTKNPSGLANSSPANAATGVATTANLVCTAASDDSPAVNYYFQIWTTSATQNSGWIAGTSWAPTLANSTTYYWHVKAKDAVSNETAYTGTWSFTTASPANTPPVVSSVTALQASSGIVNISYNVTDAEQSTVTINFKASTNGGSSWFDCTTTTGEGSQAIGSGKTGTWTAKTDIPDIYIPNAMIRVEADDGAGGNGSGDSSIFYLDTKNPTGLANSSPANAATGVATTANLVCSAASDDSPAVNYYFQIALDSAFSTGVQNSGWISGTSWAPTLANSTTYYWEVKAKDAVSNETAYTSTWSFTTEDPANTPPNVSSVVASQNGSGKVNITYNVTDAEQGTVTISFQYWNGSSWAACNTTTGEGSTSTGNGKTGTWTAKIDWPEHYTTSAKIKVIASDGIDTGSAESANFTLDTKNPTNVGCLTPADDATSVSINPTLTAMTAADDSTPLLYLFQLAQDQGFSQGLKQSSWQSSTSWNPGALNYATTYYWRVKVQDAKANESGYGQIFAFTTLSLAPDSIPPTGYVIINGGRGWTNYSTVYVTIKASDNVRVTEMIVSNDANFGSSTWQTYAESLRWNLNISSNQLYALKTVYAKFRDAAGNPSDVCSANIEYFAGKTIERIFGASRYETAVAISKKGWTTSDYVVIARGDLYPDALAGAALAYKYGAPILLTKPNALLDNVAGEIKRLKAKYAIVLGSEDALSPQVISDLVSKCGISSQNIKRIGGIDRFETASLIGTNVGKPSSQTVIMASGENYPDALASASLSAYNGMPLILVKKGDIPKYAKDILKTLDIKKVIIVGGKTVVSTDIDNLLKNLNIEVSRLSGDDRYSTAKAIADYGRYHGLQTVKVFVATGENFPDALSAGALAAKWKAPILLTSQNLLRDSAKKWFGENRLEVYQIYIAGGADVVSDGIKAEIMEAVSASY